MMMIVLIIEIPSTILAVAGYNNYSRSLYVIQCLIINYNYLYFRQFLKIELEYRKFNILCILLILVSILGVLSRIVEDNSAFLISLIQLIIGLSYIAYSIQLYRIESDKYHFAFNLIAAGALISVVASYALFYYYINALFKNLQYQNIASSIVQYLSLLEYAGFVYLYWIALKETQSDHYVKPEDRLDILG